MHPNNYLAQSAVANMADGGMRLTKTTSGKHSQCHERTLIAFAECDFAVSTVSAPAATADFCAEVRSNECLHVEVRKLSCLLEH